MRVVVLDEADEMLDMGFAEDLEAILSRTPSERQTALFSATISPTISQIARRHLREPVRISVRAEAVAGDGAARVRQVAFVVRRADKLPALCRVLDLEDPASALVFARTRDEVDDLAEALTGRGHDATALHGGMSQEQRDRVMARFRDGTLDVLVATDVAARGLDIEHVSHVVNYDIPSSPDTYVHRIGRTGRAGREGTAITFLEPREHRLLRNIESATRTRLEMGRLPTVADLRARRLEVLRRARCESAAGGRPRALPRRGRAAGRGVRRGGGGPRRDRPRRAAGGRQPEDEPEIQPATLRRSSDAGPRRPTPGFGGGPRAAQGPGPQGAAGVPRPRAAGPGFASSRRPAWTRLFVSSGRRAGIRPQDLVGAITNETGVPGASWVRSRSPTTSRWWMCATPRRRTSPVRSRRRRSRAER